MKHRFDIVSINISKKQGTKKEPVPEARLIPEHGIEGDAHAKNWHRQISLLADEDVETMRGKGVVLNPGDFGENITTRGVDLSGLPVGTKLCLGEAEAEVTQIGKECHQGCAIFQEVGDCVMPRKGIFVKVLRGGTVSRESSCYYDI